MTNVLLLEFHKSTESFLLEIMVAGQNLRDTLSLHYVHGNAVLETVGLIKSATESVKSIEERRTGLWKDADVAAPHHFLNRCFRLFAYGSATPRYPGQKLSQDFVCRNQFDLTESAAGFLRNLFPLVTWTELRDEVGGIYEDRTHKSAPEV